MTSISRGIPLGRSLSANHGARKQLALGNGLSRIEELSDPVTGTRHTATAPACRITREWTDLAHCGKRSRRRPLHRPVHSRVTVSLWDQVKRELQTVWSGERGDFPLRRSLAVGRPSAPRESGDRVADPGVVDRLRGSSGRRAWVLYDGGRADSACESARLCRSSSACASGRPGDGGVDEREIALIQACRTGGGRHRERQALRRRATDPGRAQSIFQRTVPEIAGVELGCCRALREHGSARGGRLLRRFLARRRGRARGRRGRQGSYSCRAHRAGPERGPLAGIRGKHLSPAYLLNNANDSIVPEMQPGEFVTAVLITVNRPLGRITGSRGRVHPFPVVCGIRATARNAERPASGCSKAATRRSPE